MNNEICKMIMRTEATYSRTQRKLNDEFQRLRARILCLIEIPKNLRVMIVKEEGVTPVGMQVLFEGLRKKMSDLKKKTTTINNEIHLKNTL